jgi:hypothetical protein
MGFCSDGELESGEPVERKWYDFVVTGFLMEVASSGYSCGSNSEKGVGFSSMILGDTGIGDKTDLYIT